MLSYSFCVHVREKNIQPPLIKGGGNERVFVCVGCFYVTQTAQICTLENMSRDLVRQGWKCRGQSQRSVGMEWLFVYVNRLIFLLVSLT